MKELYIYGSENPSKYSLLHIADETGKPLCGMTKRNGECTAKISRIENGKIFAKEVCGDTEVENEMYLWQMFYCSMCKKKLNRLLVTT